MSKKVILGILAVVVIAVVVWVVSQGGEENVIKVNNGDSFTISLESNPTTGYHWMPDFNAEYLELKESKFVPGTTEEVVGAGGKEEFNFLALKSGEVEAKFAYMRPWESQQPLEIKVYKVVIK